MHETHEWKILKIILLHLGRSIEHVDRSSVTICSITHLSSLTSGWTFLTFVLAFFYNFLWKTESGIILHFSLSLTVCFLHGKITLVNFVGSTNPFFESFFSFSFRIFFTYPILPIYHVLLLVFIMKSSWILRMSVRGSVWCGNKEQNIFRVKSV